MKIATLNTWGNSGPYQERWNFLWQELHSLAPDVICLQEVFNPTLTEGIKTNLRFPFSAASLEAGLCVITRFPIVVEEILNYHVVSPLESYERSAILVTLEIGKEKLLIANTHLSWKLEDRQTRIAQIEELLQAVKKLKTCAILTGDFNDIPESTPIEKIKSAGFIDTFNSLHHTSAGITWDNHNPFIRTHDVTFPNRRIDFLFAEEKLLRRHALKTCEVAFNRHNEEGIYPSDHYGLLAEIEWKSI